MMAVTCASQASKWSRGRPPIASQHSPGLIGRRVTLRGERDDPDRYGRQTAFIYLGLSASSVQSDLLARGDALVSADVTDKACAAELTAAETAARQARRGSWAESSVVKNAERPGDILARIGHFTIVEG